MPHVSFPAILGHEGAGIILRVGKGVENKSLKPGQHVLLTFNTCRSCKFCLSGTPALCVHMTAINFTGNRVSSDNSHPVHLLDGRPAMGQFFGQSSLSKLAIVHENSVVESPPLTKEIFAMMAPLGCGYQTGAGAILNVLKPTSETKLAIFGMGAVGFAAMLAAKSLGVKQICAVDMLEGKLEMARSLGATQVFNTTKDNDILAAIGGVDQIVETTGAVKLIKEGIMSLGHAGKMALVGVPRPEMSVEIDPLDFLLSCKTLIGVIEGQCNPSEVT
jgi:Zn-dependent alcohol dehydrogenase